jgi:uncharacterized membrane protein YdfJ with MMPL/SSD domain
LIDFWKRLHRCGAKIEAIAATGATANRAIFFSGMTVVLAVSGMVIIPLDIMISMGVGVMLVVVTTLLTALILLPALLGLLGDRINALRVPFVDKCSSKSSMCPRISNGTASIRRASTCSHAMPRGGQLALDELVVVTWTHDYAAREKSYALLAEAFALR